MNSQPSSSPNAGGNPSPSPPTSSYSRYPPPPPPPSTYPSLSLHPPPPPHPSTTSATTSTSTTAPNQAAHPQHPYTLPNYTDFPPHQPHAQSQPPVPALNPPPPHRLKPDKLPSPNLSRPPLRQDAPPQPSHPPLQPRQPLPPRPTMLASPRTPAVMQSIPNFQLQPLPPHPPRIHDLPTHNVLPSPPAPHQHDALSSTYPPPPALTAIHPDVLPQNPNPPPDLRRDPLNKPLQPYEIPPTKVFPPTKAPPPPQAVLPDLHTDPSHTPRPADPNSQPTQTTNRLLPAVSPVVTPVEPTSRPIPLRPSVDMQPSLPSRPLLVQSSVSAKHLPSLVASTASNPHNLAPSQHTISNPNIVVHPATSPSNLQAPETTTMSDPNQDPSQQRSREPDAPSKMGNHPPPVNPPYSSPGAPHASQKREWDPSMPIPAQPIPADNTTSNRYPTAPTHGWKASERSPNLSGVPNPAGGSKAVRGPSKWAKHHPEYSSGEISASQQPSLPVPQQAAALTLSSASGPSSAQGQPSAQKSSAAVSQAQGQVQAPPQVQGPVRIAVAGGSESRSDIAQAIERKGTQKGRLGKAEQQEVEGVQRRQLESGSGIEMGVDMTGKAAAGSMKKENVDEKAGMAAQNGGTAMEPATKSLDGGSGDAGRQQGQGNGDGRETGGQQEDRKQRAKGDGKRPIQRQQQDEQEPPPPPPPQQSQPSDTAAGTQRRQLKVEDALAYLEKVKVQFADQLTVYNQFLDIMKEFKANTIDTTQVIRRVSQLFTGHKELILGFNTFLPPGYQIQVIEDKDTGVLNTGFLGPHGFSELPAFPSPPARPGSSRPPGKKLPQVSSPKKKDNRAKPSGRSSAEGVGQAGSSQNADRTGRDVSDRAPHGGKVAAVPKGSGNRRASVKPDAPENDNAGASGAPQSQAAKMETSSYPRAEKAHEFERAINFVNTIKERFVDNPETFESFLSALSRFREEQKGIREVFEAVADVFGPHKDLLQQFKEFLPAIAIGAVDDSRAKGALSIPQRRPGASKTFSQSTPTKKGPGGQGHAKPRQKARDLQFFDNLKASLGPENEDVFRDFIKCIELFNQKIVPKEEMENLVMSTFEPFPDAQSMFMQFVDSALGSGDETVEDGNGSSSMSSEGEAVPIDAARQAHYLKKPVSEMASEYGQATEGSYRGLPADFPRFECSGRAGIDKKTLNDHWVSVTSGSEDYSFKFMRKNGHEDNLFRCEDDRYELDMLIETNASTIQRLEAIVLTISKLPNSEKKRHALAPGALSAINFSTIQRIYGDTHGPEVISQLRLNPSQTAPVVIKRLQGKDVHWRQARHEMNKLWRDVGEKNFHKSMDHRSALFKLVDKKEASAKLLLSDILDPVSSLGIRDAEVTKHRGYPTPNGAGGVYDRSGSFKALVAAAEILSSNSPRSLELVCEEVRIHRLVVNILQQKIIEDTSSSNEGRRIAEDLRLFIERFFDIEFFEDAGCKRANRISARGNSCSVLYGDDGIYLLLRLYHLLFERLMIGLSLAREQIRDKNKRRKLNKDGLRPTPSGKYFPDLEGLSFPESILTASGQGGDAFVACSEHETPDELFEEYLGLLDLLLRSRLDSGKYEEKSRMLLGPGSFILFVLDKLVVKAVKQVISVFGADGKSNTDGTLGHFHQAIDRLEHAMEGGGRLTPKALEEVYLNAAVSSISRVRGSGANVMRFQCVYDAQGQSHFVIHVIGQTGGGDGNNIRNIEAEEVEKFVNRITGGREEYRESHERDVDMRRIGGRDDVRAKKRERGVNCDFVRFCGPAAERERRMKDMQLVLHNGLQWKMDSKGRMRAVKGTSDYLKHEGRKRGLWESDVDPQEANAKSVWAAKFRSKLSRASNAGNEEGAAGEGGSNMEVDQEREKEEKEDTALRRRKDEASEDGAGARSERDNDKMTDA
eukprot:GFKZ01003446.1.p1 GENE.GFKZ01003446.1~~GFKZ01003446.1.p1  ORF type:complete len:1910 (+),score=287.86 GFKZ01003446.1:187-5916(+)